jgi:hypothetical protein
MRFLHVRRDDDIRPGFEMQVHPAFLAMQPSLWVAMQQTWNWHATEGDDFFYLRPASAQEGYVRYVVAWALNNFEAERERRAHVPRNRIIWPFLKLYQPRGWIHPMSVEDRRYWNDVVWPRILAATR